MKTVDKMEVLHSQSAEYIQQGETGKFLKLIPDTFLIKGKEKDGVFNQGYAIRHINRRDIILIDVVEEDTKGAVKKLVDEGYQIKGILITCDGILDDAYADLKTISEDANGAPIYAHPRNNFKDDFKTKDITTQANDLKHFGIKVIDLPGNGGASVLVYSEINDGMLFPGDDAVGSDYDSELNTFKRPEMKRENDDFGLAESWNAFEDEFTYFFPRKGKPAFNVDEGQQIDILNGLSRTK
ncbi:MBL fold metallo-hydrolase [Zunongwangia sp. SCSIO 43204]|uniref:MBL fold metallo-hydrolase n=1 Tax=Zunongwangia sp. SCSIO 43204 TaxID=2779359 RepID=UPI001CA81909|nr:MBL fold metallo-hydrolase [Zunongwangia sp. SCSIO 43204]UAB83415.1 MBL fold metallo-hydrolase [Zunongwangia sp. SCSIO 43204]